MGQKEQERLLRLIESVEKEESRREEDIENPGRIRRQLFIDERPPEHIDELASDDDVEDSIEIQEENSESEQSEEELANIGIYPEYIGKDGITKWAMHCPTTKRRVSDLNLVRRLPGVPNLIDVDSPVKAWKLFFTDEILENIVRYTNQRIGRVRRNYSRERDALETSKSEIENFIGLLFMLGILKASHLNLYDLWQNDGTGVEFFRNNMNVKRFKFLIRNIRFDDSTTRQQRKMYDKLAPIRELFAQVVEKCKTNFNVSEYLTIDEMLESFRGRCSFRQYIKNKPAKYGLKIFALTCSKTFYTMNMEVYTGTQPDGPYKVDNSGLAVVSRLVQPISGTRRNVTTDNWYTSIPLAEHLLSEHSLTLVGTLRKNKREIPPEFLNTRLRPVNSSMFGFRKEMTLVSYVAKKNKIVPLLSTMHHSDEIDPESEDAQKPYILTFYNSTKGGVDVVDEYKSNYSVARSSNRWPLTLFFSLLNITALNAYIVFKHKGGNFTLERKAFLKQLSKNLCNDYLTQRCSNKNIPRPIKRKIRDMLGLEEERRAAPNQEDEGPGRCIHCDTKKNRKSKLKCSVCHYFICKEHATTTCVKCANPGSSSSDE